MQNCACRGYNAPWLPWFSIVVTSRKGVAIFVASLHGKIASSLHSASHGCPSVERGEDGRGSTVNAAPRGHIF